MSTDIDKEIRRAKDMAEENIQIRQRLVSNFEEIREINRRINKAYKENEVSPGERVSTRRMREIFEKIPPDVLQKLYNRQKEKLSESDRKEYKKLINNKQEKA